MNVRTLSVLAAVLGLGQIGTTIIWKEGWFGVVFALAFVAGAALLGFGRVLAGAILVGLLSLVDVISAPTWTRHGAFQLSYQITYAALALIALIAAGVAVVGRARSSAHAPAPTH